MLAGVLDGRQGTNDTLIVRDLFIRVQGNIEVNLENTRSVENTRSAKKATQAAIESVGAGDIRGSGLVCP